MLPLKKELALLSRSIYPLAELLQRPLPEGVDPTNIERYLSPGDFQEILSMSKEEFEKLPSWKKTALKKEKGLFWPMLRLIFEKLDYLFSGCFDLSKSIDFIWSVCLVFVFVSIYLIDFLFNGPELRYHESIYSFFYISLLKNEKA